jgi:ATP-dependent RNA helicase DeaD
VQFLVVAPTRELTQQIAVELTKYSEGVKNLKVEAVYGGAAIINQIRSIQKNVPHILVATPGRLIDLLKRGVIKVKNVKAVILDEADEMLNMGFKDDIYEILTYTNREKNVWLFSATMARDIRAIADQFMESPKEVSVNSSEKVNKNIEHQYCQIKRSDKTSAIKRYLDYIPDMYGLVFCRTRLDTQQVADDLTRDGYQAEALHGDLSQQQRDRVMKKFRSRAIKMVVATDVAARGIDVDDLTHVFHYSLPDDVEFYTHRSGRTARAGKTGISMSLVTPSDERKFKTIQRELKAKFTRVEVPTLDEVKKKKVFAWAEELLSTKVLPEVKEGWQKHVLAQFDELTKEDLIDRLLSWELKKLQVSERADLNARSSSRDSSERGDRRERSPRGERSDRGDRRERPERRKRDDKDSSSRRSDRKTGDRDAFASGPREPRRSSGQSSGNAVRYFINVGEMDGVDRGSLVEFVSEQANVQKDDIGGISIRDKFSFFDVNKNAAEAIETKFEGLSVNGRPLRVNKEEN